MELEEKVVPITNAQEYIAIKRKQIDKLDSMLLTALAMRMQICSEIGKWKKENNIAITDARREETMKQSREQVVNHLGLSNEFVDQLFAKIVEHSKELQK